MVWIILFLSLVLPSGVIDNSYLPIRYSGAWVVVDEALAHEGSYHETSTGSFTFDFFGDAFALYGKVSPGGGSADVCIVDECVTASWHHESVTAYRIEIIAISGLDVDQHTVSVTATGDGDINLEAIYIAPVFAVELEPDRDSWQIVDEEGRLFELSMTTGEQSIATLLFSILIILLSFFLIELWYKASS